MARALIAVLVAMPLIGADPKFEEASVNPADCAMRSSLNPGRIALNGYPLKAILSDAFQVKMDQTVGPSWLEADCFTIVATIPNGVSGDQRPAMMRALLAERFKLTAHKGARPGPGYALALDKGGPKFKESDAASLAASPAGQIRFGFSSASAVAGFKGSTTMAFLARYLSNKLGAPVEDLTGMKGTYGIEISWAPDPALERSGNFDSVSPADAASVPAGTASVFTALRESLGLRLESQKQQIETIVIDHIERVPTEN